MSLIIEALKRARDDAVRRQAAARGLPLAPIPRLAGRKPWLAIAIVPLAAALVICVLLLIDLYSRLPESTPVSDVGVAPDPVAEPLAGAAVSAPTTQPAPAAAPMTSEPAASGSVITAVPPAEPAARLPEPDAADEPRSRPEPQATAATEPLEAATETPDEPGAESDGAQIFVGQAQLPTGQVIDLGGIAWSESEPYALLNGQVVGVGERIRTYRIVEITRSEVVLEQNGDRLILRLQ